MKKDFLALDKHITLKEKPVYNQKDTDGCIRFNVCGWKTANLKRQGK